MLRNNRNNINPEYDFNIDDTRFDYLREYPFLDFDENFDSLPDFFPAYELDDGASERKEYFQFGEDPALQRSGSGVLPPQPGTVSASFAGDSYALDGSIEQDSLFSELFESMPVAASSLNGPDSGSPEDFMAAILGDINHVSSPATPNRRLPIGCIQIIWRRNSADGGS